MKIKRMKDLKLLSDKCRTIVRKSRGLSRKRREIEIANKLHEVHRPYWQRYEETKMAVDDEIDFEDSMVINYDAKSRLIETSSDLVYIHEYDDYYKEYQHDMTEELSDAYQKIFDKKMNEFTG